MPYKVTLVKTIAANDGTQISSFEIAELRDMEVEGGLVKFHLNYQPFYVSSSLIATILPTDEEVFEDAVSKAKAMWADFRHNQLTIQ